jgi:predicted AlkP superfamily phosphohydrolase/phosphomutase
MLPLTARGNATSFRTIAEPFQLGQVLPPPPSNARVTMILLDGASLSFITPATAEGRLPNLGKLLDNGAAMHLATIRPTQPAPAWAVATTGKLPQVNGVRSAATFSFGAGNHEIELLPDMCFARALVHLGLIEEHLNLSTTLRARPVWQILSAFGMSVGITGLPLTNPVFPVRGFLVSDRAHTVVDATTPGVSGALVYPRDAFVTPSPLGESVDAPVIDPPQATIDPERLARDLSPRDAWYRAIARDLEGRFDPQVRAVRFVGIDIAGHYYLRFAQPRAFGDVSDEERRRLGTVLDEQYAAIDREIGERLAALGPNDVLFVVSAFGLEPVSIGKRLLARMLGEPDITGTHEGAPDGFLIAYGSRVRRARLPVGSIADVTPTLLYLLGLPVGRDMQGTARTDLFTREFSETRPLTFITTYDR